MALRAGLAAALTRSDGAGVVVDPHLQVLGAEGSVMQLLQEVGHPWKEEEPSLHHKRPTAGKQYSAIATWEIIILCTWTIWLRQNMRVNVPLKQFQPDKKLTA